MRKLERLYQEYESIIWRKSNDMETATELELFWRVVQIMDLNLYYKLQAKIFVEAQRKNRELAQEIVNDCMKMFNRFTLNSLELYLDEMQFKDEELYKCNQARFYGLGMVLPQA